MAELKIPIEITDETIERIAKAVVAEIRKEQNADLVEIVRCRDCKWCKHFAYGLHECKKVHLIPIESREELDWFCADGVRKDADRSD